MKRINRNGDSHYQLLFHSIRNISSPEDKENDRTIYIGQAPLTSILDLPADENVRGYLADSPGKQRKSYTSVHKAIRDTLLTDAEKFSVLNSGIVIVARDLSLDEKDRTVTLKNPSIINGSQTQGVINDLYKDGLLPTNAHIKFEIVVTTDEELIADVSIARNYQNSVLSISVAGRLSYFDELERRFKEEYPSKSLRKSETDLPSDTIVDTEKLLQVITALIPQELWDKPNESDIPNKVYTYSQKSRCLKEFQEIYKKAKEGSDKYADLYDFYLDTAAFAYNLYGKWKKHQGFKFSKEDCIIKNDKGDVTEVPDGIIFPIIASLSLFAENDLFWYFNIPKNIDDRLISTALSALKEIAKSNPQTMGKNKACYNQLHQISSIYKELTS